MQPTKTMFDGVEVDGSVSRIAKKIESLVDDVNGKKRIRKLIKRLAHRGKLTGSKRVKYVFNESRMQRFVQELVEAVKAASKPF